jgi:hypothetical protein
VRNSTIRTLVTRVPAAPDVVAPDLEVRRRARALARSARLGDRRAQAVVFRVGTAARRGDPVSIRLARAIARYISQHAVDGRGVNVTRAGVMTGAAKMRIGRALGARRAPRRARRQRAVASGPPPSDPDPEPLPETDVAVVHLGGR